MFPAKKAYLQLQDLGLLGLKICGAFMRAPLYRQVKKLYKKLLKINSIILNDKFPDLELILIESGGDNLAATFSPELVDLTIYMIDVAQGADIPRKKAPAIRKSDLLVINKVDLAPYVNVDLEQMKEDVNEARNGLPYIFGEMKNNNGIEKISDFLISQGGL